MVETLCQITAVGGGQTPEFLWLEGFLEKRGGNGVGKWKGRRRLSNATLIGEKSYWRGWASSGGPGDPASLRLPPSSPLGLEKGGLWKALGCPGCSRCAPSPPSAPLGLDASRSLFAIPAPCRLGTSFGRNARRTDTAPLPCAA